DEGLQTMKDRYGEISAHIDGHVAVLEIDRPPNNFVSVELMRDLADALTDIDEEKWLRASVLAAAGKVFCAGADLASPTGVGEEALAWGLADEMVPLDELRAAALALATEIAEAAPLAVVSTRATLRAGLAEAVRTQTDHEQAEQTWLRATNDFAEGVKSVFERRPSVFTGP